jgi:hypothetical protein
MVAQKENTENNSTMENNSFFGGRVWKFCENVEGFLRISLIKHH